MMVNVLTIFIVSKLDKTQNKSSSDQKLMT